MISAVDMRLYQLQVVTLSHMWRDAGLCGNQMCAVCFIYILGKKRERELRDVRHVYGLY